LKSCRRFEFRGTQPWEKKETSGKNGEKKKHNNKTFTQALVSKNRIMKIGEGRGQKRGELARKFNPAV